MELLRRQTLLSPTVVLLAFVVYFRPWSHKEDIRPDEKGSVHGCSTLHSQDKSCLGEWGQFGVSKSHGPNGRRWIHVGHDEISDSEMGIYKSAAVATEAHPCSHVAKTILTKKGTAADAAIAAALCLGVFHPHAAGIGGGFMLTYYQKSTKTSFVLDSREVAPLAATEDMFEMSTKNSSKEGGLAVAVPGAVRGYRELYRRFGGGVPWKDLFEPAITMCEEGSRVNWHLERALLANQWNVVNHHPSMRVFTNPITGVPYRTGEIMYRPVLGKTLRAIQNDPDSLYSGEASKLLMSDLRKFGSIIAEKDLMSYKPKWKTPVKVALKNGGYTVHTLPPPASGVVFASILNILDGYNWTPTNLTKSSLKLRAQKLSEAMKHSFAIRTHLADPDFVNLTDCTAHISIVAANGDAVAMTNSVNTYFGAKIVSLKTGMLLNNQMDDFYSPTGVNHYLVVSSPANRVQPGKRPLSSMSASIITDKFGDVRLVLGGSGGSRIPSSSAQVAINNLWLGKNLKESVDALRLHHQLQPMELGYEVGYNEDVLSYLAHDRGHRLDPWAMRRSAVSAVSRENGYLYANYDYRKPGQVDGY